MTRPHLLVVATGTGTEIGKTWWGAATLAATRAKGSSVAARKPVQSGTDERPTDAEVLAGATGEPVAEVCPPHRWLRPALAPPMAADELGQPAFTIADLVAELEWPDPAVDVGWVEGAGGLRSPLTADGDTLSLVRALAPGFVVVVADAGLGTINAVRLTVDALGATRAVVALNRFDPSDSLHRRNRDWLVERDHCTVVTGPGELAALLHPRV